MKITIKGKKIEMRYTMRSMMIYEKIMNKSFSPQGLTEVVAYFYASILGSAKDITLSFDDFLDWLDEHPKAITEFSEWLQAVLTRNGYIRRNEEKAEGDGKNA